MNRSGSAGESTENSALSAYKAAYGKFIRKGTDHNLADLQAKALSVGSDVDGGYLVLPEMSSTVEKKVFESSPMRQLASVQSISSDNLEIVEDLFNGAAQVFLNNLPGKAGRKGHCPVM